jgi:dTDP-glucose pyrophosphorylase
MLLLAGKPMLEHIVSRLQLAGVAEILLVVGYRRELIEGHFAQWDGIHFVTQEVIEGTARAVALGRDFIGSDPFLLTFGDIMCAPGNYSGIAAMREARNASAAIGVQWADDPSQGAAVYADEAGCVTRIIEKPAPGTSTTNWNSAGLYAFAPVVFDEIARVTRSARGEFEITSAIERLITAGEPVCMFEMKGLWRDVGRPEDLGAAVEALNS